MTRKERTIVIPTQCYTRVEHLHTSYKYPMGVVDLTTDFNNKECENMSNLKENIHVRISNVQLDKLTELTDHYQTSVSNLVRYFIHHGLLKEHQNGSTHYINTMNQKQRGF